SGFCANMPYPQPGSGAPIDRYKDLQAMVANGAATPQGTSVVYCNPAFALLRILIPYVVDGHQAYEQFEQPIGNAPCEGLSQASCTNTPGTSSQGCVWNSHFNMCDPYNDWVTSMSYRNYVRGRIFDLLTLPESPNANLSGVDLFFVPAAGDT